VGYPLLLWQHTRDKIYKLHPFGAEFFGQNAHLLLEEVRVLKDDLMKPQDFVAVIQIWAIDSDLSGGHPKKFKS